MHEPMDYSEYLEDIEWSIGKAKADYGFDDVQSVGFAFDDLGGRWSRFPRERTLALIASGRHAMNLGLEQFRSTWMSGLWRDLFASGGVLDSGDELPTDQRHAVRRDAVEE